MKTLPILFIALLLASCETSKPKTLRIMLGAGSSELEVDGNSSQTIDGDQLSFRVEVAQEVASNVEFGIRGLLGTHDFDETEGGLTLDFETTDLGLVGVVRPFVDINQDFRAYIEGFAGYRHYFGDATISGPGISISSEDDDGGAIFGLGLGGEFRLNDRSRIVLGIEFSRHLTNDAGIDLDADDLSFLIGMSLSF